MIRVVLDWESAYGVNPTTGENITLSRMTTEEYVRHPLFKAHGLGVKIDQDKPFYLYKKDDLVKFLRTHPWSKTFAIAHHAHFDLAVLSWRCGIRPAFIGDTLSMARAIFPYERLSLARLSMLLGIGEKGHEVQNTAGKWWLTDIEQAALGRYCINDVELTARIFDLLKGHFPLDELRLIDWTIRAFTEPAIVINPSPLVHAYVAERRRKRALIKQCVGDAKILSSGDQFAQLLLSMGVDPPKKISPAKIKDGRVNPDEIGEPPEGLLPSFKAPKGATAEQRAALTDQKKFFPWSYAFGKSDEEFKLLLDHPDPKIQAVVEARMGVKSTIKETRSKRYYKIGRRGRFPVYLNYYGAHSGRWSGGDKQNAQNLTRVDKRDPTAGALRLSWTALPGHKIVVRDSGQIEARVLVYWAGQEDMLDMFRAGGDPYDFMASKIYAREVKRNEVPEDKAAGQVGKVVVLGCGYGLGEWKLQASVRVGFMGMPGVIFGQEYVEQLGVNIDAWMYRPAYHPNYKYCIERAEACCPLNVSMEDHIRHCAVTAHIVSVFRQENPYVKALWKECQRNIPTIILGDEVYVGEREMIHTCREGLVLPNSMKIRYNKLRLSSSGKEYKYLADVQKKEWTRLYGGKIAENGVQSLARIIVLGDQKLRIIDNLRKYRINPKTEVAKVVSSTHDEIITMVPDRYAEDCLEMMNREMRTPPSWCPDLPLKSSGGYAISYGDCEK